MAALYAGTTLDIQSISIGDQDKSIKVSRGGDGWVLPDAEAFPATAVQATDTISKVLTIDRAGWWPAMRPAIAGWKSPPKDFVRHVDLETTDGQTLTLYVGSSPSFRSTNVPRGDSDDILI